MATASNSAALSEAPSDPTFRRHHIATGGQLGTLLDVGCGPGAAIRALAPSFARGFGVDPSVEMINIARASVGPSPAPTTPIHFAAGTAESLPGVDLADHLPPSSVDLLTAATAAHWFDMSLFWPGASALVRPGGTVALWTTASYYCHPHTTPNAKEVQRVLDRLEHERLAPFKTRGNEISSSLYRELVMLWEVEGGAGGR